MKNGTYTPKIKRRRMPGTTKEHIKIKDSKGKTHRAKVKRYTEAEIEDKTLHKIAPMYFFSEESNKVLMIPFSIKMTPEEFTKQTAAQAVNFQKVIERINKKAKKNAE